MLVWRCRFFTFPIGEGLFHFFIRSHFILDSINCQLQNVPSFELKSAYDKPTRKVLRTLYQEVRHFATISPNPGLYSISENCGNWQLQFAGFQYRKFFYVLYHFHDSRSLGKVALIIHKIRTGGHTASKEITNWRPSDHKGQH